MNPKHVLPAGLNALRRRVKYQTKGFLEYFFKPELRASWGGPMNGQEGRQQIWKDLVAAMPASAIVETGTFRGTTTEFFAAFGLPVHTVEANPRFYGFSRARIWANAAMGRHVRLTLSDSRSFLRALASDPRLPKENVIFYLDAHWADDLPLADEISIIFGAWRQAVIMVDDFAVPGEPYEYDDYGPGKVLNREYLDAIGRRDLHIFYPALPAAAETGKKRGSVVLCNDETTRARLAGLKTLRVL